MNKPCEEFADRIVDYVDGELPENEAQAVARHLAECEGCRRMVEALQRSLGLAKIIWQDNLTVRSDAARRFLRRPGGHTANLLRRRSFYAVAAAAVVLLAMGGLLVPTFRPRSKSQPVTWEDAERQIARAGTAAQLLAATRIVAQCAGTESIVEQQYRYILREYAGTPAAESIKTSHELRLGGTQHE